MSNQPLIVGDYQGDSIRMLERMLEAEKEEPEQPDTQSTDISDSETGSDDDFLTLSAKSVSMDELINKHPNEFLTRRQLVINRPTNQDIYLYEHWGEYPLEADKLKLNLSHVENLVDWGFLGQTDFGQTICSNLPNYCLGKELKMVYLHMKCKDEANLLGSIGSLIDQVEFFIGDERIQKYSGWFLDNLWQLEGKSIYPNAFAGDIWIPLPWNFHQYQTFPVYYCQSKLFKIKIKLAKLPIQQAEKPLAEIQQARLYLEYHQPNPLIPEMLVSSLKSTTCLWEEIQSMSEDLGQCQAVKLRLPFKGPIKSIIWRLYYQDKNGVTYPVENQILNTAKIQINSRDLSDSLPGSYFNGPMNDRFNPNGLNASRSNTDWQPNLYSYSFTQHPTWPRPTGSLNMHPDNIPTMQMILNVNPKKLPGDVHIKCDIWAISYNILQLDVKKGAAFVFI